MKRIFVLASLSLITVAAYQWGNSAGRAGQGLQLIETSVAAENPDKISPVLPSIAKAFPVLPAVML